MIIQIRGTSGSGKSTVVRNLIDGASQVLRIKVGGDAVDEKLSKRKQPLGYALDGWKVAIPGHYESACGGCDTLPGQDITFSQVKQAAAIAKHVVFEGLLASEEVNRTIELHNDHPGQLRVILLTTPVETCLGGIRDRRVARGDERPLKEDNTRNRVRVIQRACERLKAAGVEVIEAPRDDAMTMVRSWLA